MNQEQVLQESPLTLTETSKSETLSPEQHREAVKYLYELCKEQYPDLLEIAKLFLERAENDYDNQIAVEGVTGSGKSMVTLIINLLMSYKLNRVYNIKKQTLFIPDEGELKRSVHNLKELDCYWVDEAIRALDKKRWHNNDQIDLNHVIKTERWKRNTIIYCMPDFRDFTNSFRTSNIYFRLFIIPRFAAVLHVKDIDKDVEDPWHTRLNCSIKYGKTMRNGFTFNKYKAVMPPNERLELEKKLPNYHTHSAWPDISADPITAPLWQEYITLKEQSRAEQKEKELYKEKEGRSKYDMKYKELLKPYVQQKFNEANEPIATHWRKHWEGKMSIRAFTEIVKEGGAMTVHDKRIAEVKTNLYKSISEPNAAPQIQT